jgi:hypothetical protein
LVSQFQRSPSRSLTAALRDQFRFSNKKNNKNIGFKKGLAKVLHNRLYFSFTTMEVMESTRESTQDVGDLL